MASKKPEGLKCCCLVLAHTRLDVNKVVRKKLGARRASFASEGGGLTPSHDAVT